MVVQEGRKEGARFYLPPSIHLAPASVGVTREAYDVPGDKFLGSRVAQSAAQDRPGVADCPLGCHAPTARCRNFGAAAALVLRPPGILTLRAALAGVANLGQPGPHVAERKLVEPLLAEERQGIQPHDDLVSRTGQRCVARRDHYLAQPVRQVIAHCRIASRDWPTSRSLMQLKPLAVHSFAGLVVDPLAAPRTIWGGHPHVGCVAGAVRE